MHRLAYAEILEETPSRARERERAVVERAVTLLRAAEAEGPRSREAVEALVFLRRLWLLLIEDLASRDNDLPQALRADLISIGLWVMREADRIRLEQSADFTDLIAVMQSLAEGLR
ncbi:MAG: flagellar biosynthesis regulator FlaF [Hyphomicrobiaceae bacterium]|nr:flagellar biosynthesis regulator FlaF [Hyphomicrobiaceae bacterium]